MLKGSRVCLRAFEMNDLNAEHAFVNDMETLQSMLRGIPFPASMSDEQQWLSQQTSYTRGEYQFAVEDLEGNLVGRCGVTALDWKNRVAELAIMIGSPYRRRGYGKEAMRLLLDFCFGEMNLHKVKVSVLATNEAAIACYQSNGFICEGRLAQEVFRAGQYRDVVLMAKFAP